MGTVLSGAKMQPMGTVLSGAKKQPERTVPIGCTIRHAFIKNEQIILAQII